MWKLLLPLVLIACNSTTNSPETKKVSLNLKETCDKGQYYKVDKPYWWQANITYHDKTPKLISRQLDIDWFEQGFVLPCGYGTEGDTEAILTIVYN